MRARKAASLGLLILLLNFWGCSSGSGSFSGGGGSSGTSISISPASAVAGSPDLTLIVTGRHFANARHNRSTAVWSENANDIFLATSFVSDTTLTAVIPAALLSSPVEATVFVETGDPMGDNFLKSDSVTFVVAALPPGAPWISSISPTSVVAGSPDLTLTVTGSNFANHNSYRSYAVWSVNDSATYLATTFVDSTQLTAVVPAALLINPVKAAVSVEIWYKADDIPTAVSNSVVLSVNAP